MSLRDYARYDGTPSFTRWGDFGVEIGLVGYINDGDDNSYLYAASGGIEKSGSYEFKVQVPSRFMEELKFITYFTGTSNWSLGFKLQYYNGAWQTLYTKALTVGFSEAKTTRSYTNGGLGFENVTYIRLWVEWATGVGAGNTTSTYCYSLIGNSQYYPASGIRFKTNDGLIGIGKDTAVGAHKLRFYDGATIQGLPMVATNSRYATNIRIYDGVATKALVQVIT